LLALSSGRATAGDAPRAIDAIENDLVVDDPAVRAKAALELVDRFPDGAVAVPMLVDLLDDESLEVVAAAAKAIDSMAVSGAGVLAAFYADDAHWKPGTPFMKDAPLAIGQSAVFALFPERRRLATPVADSIALCALLPEREELIGDEQAATPWLTAFVRQAPPPARTIAAAALAMHGLDAVAAKSIPASPHGGRSTATAAALALVQRGDDLRAWMGTRLVERLRPVDAAAVSALLAKIAPTQKGARPAPLARIGACRALAAIGASAAGAAPALSTLVAGLEPDLFFQVQCARTLAAIGKEADVAALVARKAPSADALVIALAREKRAAATVVPYLTDGLSKAADPAVDFVSMLAEYGPAAAPAAPVLKRKVRDIADIGTKLIYADALLAIAPTDADGTRIVEDQMKDSSSWASSCSPVAILATRAEPTPRLVEQLLGALRSPAVDPSKTFYDYRAVDALGRCGASAKSAVPDFVRLLADSDKQCADPAKQPRRCPQRRRLAIALGRIGPDAAAAVPALTALRDKGDETIRVAAAQALRRIRAKK
jgi:hypothetical protein